MSPHSRTTSLSISFAVCAAAVVFLAGPGTAADKQPAAAPAMQAKPVIARSSTTLKNLMESYNKQSNIRHRYLAFAQKADQEKYHKVAELFRAAARSEEIHIAMYAKNITKLGGTPTADIQALPVKSTTENLAEAINEIVEENGTLYPKFLAQAQADSVPEGIMTFGVAEKIRGNQKVIFEKALANLSSWKKADGGFYVCTVCGNLVEKLDFAACPVCKAPVKDFVQVK